MMDLAGAPLLERILERVKRCTAIDQIVLATSVLKENQILLDLANRCGIDSFAGSEHDLVDRYYQAARRFGADIVGRLPADNVAPEPTEIDRIAHHHRHGDFAYSSNLVEILGNGYPDGIGAEMISFWTLEEIWRTETNPYNREHVTTSFYDFTHQRVVDPQRFPVSTVPCPSSFSRPDIKLDVNTQEDYLLMREMYEALFPVNPQFGIKDIIQWHDARFPNH